MKTFARTTSTLHHLVLATLAAAAFGGCALDGDGAVDGAGDEVELPTISRTVVHTKADGTPEVLQDWITPAEQRAEIDARAARLAGDGGRVARDLPENGEVFAVDCSNQNSIWLFDGPNLTGNEICFYAPADVVIFKKFQRGSLCDGSMCFILNWAGAVRSYWAGSERGFLNKFIGQDWRYEAFSAWQRVDNAGEIGRVSDFMTLVSF